MLIRVQFPDSPDHLPILGQVIWKNADAGKFKPEDLGMGVQFVDASAEHLLAVERQLTHAIAAGILKILR